MIDEDIWCHLQVQCLIFISCFSSWWSMQYYVIPDHVMSHLNIYSHIEFYLGLSKLIWIKDKVSTYLHQAFCVMLLQLNKNSGSLFCSDRYLRLLTVQVNHIHMLYTIAHEIQRNKLEFRNGKVTWYQSLIFKSRIIGLIGSFYRSYVIDPKLISALAGLLTLNMNGPYSHFSLIE